MKRLIGVALIAAVLITATGCTASIPDKFQTTLPVQSLPLDEMSGERLDQNGENAEITHIVIHFASDVIANPENPHDIEAVRDIFASNEVSTHYFIDRDGVIYHSVPEQRAAWHAGRGSLSDFPDYENRLNHHSIGIELLAIGSKADMAGFLSEDEYDALSPDLIGFTLEQYSSLNALVSDILNRHKAINPNRRHVIGHSEYSAIGRSDPGELFDWGRIDGIEG